MGFYLNSNKPASLYLSETKNPYFVDKTEILSELIPLVERGKQYVCITRPRRFGKTIMANMIGAFFGKNNKGAMFDKLKIAADEKFSKHKNQHNVIYITLNEMPEANLSYSTYMKRIKNRLLKDLRRAYPDCEIEMNDALWDALNDIHECNGNMRLRAGLLTAVSQRKLLLWMRRNLQ